uniref:Uncharacterized protein n=1 Tax=Oryza nivara TaxID=4536 RepID=A0A0E0G3G5_ORYNI
MEIIYNLLVTNAWWGVSVCAVTGADRVLETGKLARCVETVMVETEAAGHRHLPELGSVEGEAPWSRVACGTTKK